MELPMFEQATRRAVLRRGLALTGVLLAGDLLAACGGNGDKEAFATSTTTPTTTLGAVPTTAAPTTTAARASTTTTTKAATTTSAPPGSTAAATGNVVSLAFTYTAADTSGRVNNPFLAAWVEDASGNLVGLISVVYLTRESKYLRELTSWAAAGSKVTAAQLDAVTGATRSAGAYKFQWNGKGLDGTVLKGKHTIWLEAAREHGPHSVTKGEVALGAAGTFTLPASGELSSVAVNVV
jgi:hypothetical protein